MGINSLGVLVLSVQNRKLVEHILYTFRMAQSWHDLLILEMFSVTKVRGHTIGLNRSNYREAMTCFLMLFVGEAIIGSNDKQSATELLSKTQISKSHIISKNGRFLITLPGNQHFFYCSRSK